MINRLQRIVMAYLAACVAAAFTMELAAVLPEATRQGRSFSVLA
jgi:hypothetical protein